MTETKLANPQITTLSVTDLSAVTTATTGSGADIQKFSKKTVFVNVSVNTGAVTVTISASPNNSTWFTLDSKTYTATTGTDVFSYNSYFPYIRTATSTQSNSTVTTTITARS